MTLDTARCRLIEAGGVCQRRVLGGRAGASGTGFAAIGSGFVVVFAVGDGAVGVAQLGRIGLTAQIGYGGAEAFALAVHFVEIDWTVCGECEAFV